MGGFFAGHCRRCARLKQPGDIFYIVRVTLTCDFDGELRELGDEELAREIKDQLDQAEQKPEQELMDEVYQELGFYLCKKCRDWLVQGGIGKDLAQGAAVD